ncbi:uncharacterized protein EV154DRAFT_399439, partial [Mucor mucedo]|uniref:uncharacterized protein n=1 Tax=Mucor mucedo TaxID=29922 RepID=UPI0022205A27
GRPEEEENRELLTKLRKCKQQKGESVKLYSAHWKHLLSLLPANHLEECQQILLFTQGILNDGLRTYLITYSDVKELDTMKAVIEKAINLETKARL